MGAPTLPSAQSKVPAASNKVENLDCHSVNPSSPYEQLVLCVAQEWSRYSALECHVSQIDEAIRTRLLQMGCIGHEIQRCICENKSSIQFDPSLPTLGAFTPVGFAGLPELMIANSYRRALGTKEGINIVLLSPELGPNYEIVTRTNLSTLRTDRYGFFDGLGISVTHSTHPIEVTLVAGVADIALEGLRWCEDHGIPVLNSAFAERTMMSKSASAQFIRSLLNQEYIERFGAQAPDYWNHPYLPPFRRISDGLFRGIVIPSPTRNATTKAHVAELTTIPSAFGVEHNANGLNILLTPVTLLRTLAFAAMTTAKRYVVKPDSESQGYGVTLHDSLLPLDTVRDCFTNLTLLSVLCSPQRLEVGVESYPLYRNGVRLDWNIRALVDKSGIIDYEARVSSWGGPINKSQGAEIWEVRDVLSALGANSPYIEGALKHKIGEFGRLFCTESRANLIGLDIICDAEGALWTCEPNGELSGGISSLADLRGGSHALRASLRQLNGVTSTLKQLKRFARHPSGTTARAVSALESSPLKPEFAKPLQILLYGPVERKEFRDALEDFLLSDDTSLDNQDRISGAVAYISALEIRSLTDELNSALVRLNTRTLPTPYLLYRSKASPLYTKKEIGLGEIARCYRTFDSRAAYQNLSGDLEFLAAKLMGPEVFDALLSTYSALEELSPPGRGGPRRQNS